VSVENVLVVPTEVLRRLGLFQGFLPDAERYLTHLLDPAHLRYLPRPQAENDPEHKQLIPYVVLRWRDQVFHYVRGASGGEKRLHALRSIGIGGHICSEDGGLGPDAYDAGMRREVLEEVYLDTVYRERLLGLINDDSTPVGQVHLGIVHLFDLVEPRAARREEALAADGFAPLAELREDCVRFETWSQFLLRSDQL
jgi:predicted NUDIX family phosphoesterase